MNLGKGTPHDGPLPLLPLLVSATDPAAKEPGQPITFEFKRQSGPSDERQQAYDPKTQVYYLRVRDIARFEIQAVVPELQDRRVTLRITGMLDKPEGPLTLHVPARDGQGEASYGLDPGQHDKDLFRIERREGVTTIEFLAKGKRLLRPGSWFQYIDFYR